MKRQVQEADADNWRARGDMPMRDTPHAAFLVDGRMTMLEMCLRFLSATRSIYITAWGLTPEMLLVRGKHNRAGPDGSPEQKELLDWLRGRGLGERELAFWQECDELSVANVLGYAARKGVDVKLLLWNTYTLPFQISPKKVQDALQLQGVCCLLDDSHMGLLNHPLEAHHQKTIVVDSRYAFVGGIDMMIENGGDYDRWDTKGHPYHTPLRLDKDNKMPHSWHDVHVLFEGPAVADVEKNFRQRWNDLVKLHEMEAKLIIPDIAPPAAANTIAPLTPERGTLIQVTRTIPRGTYAFAPEEGIATIRESYQRAFTLAKRSIYIENQYFWRRTFLGIGNPALGVPHPDMEELIQSLAHALERGVMITILLPDRPNVGREFTDEGLKHLTELAPLAIENGRLKVYTLGSSWRQDEKTVYRSIYVHGKVAIVDDLWITVGSANLNHRGMRDDTEMNVMLMQPEIARALRILLMAEHLGVCDEDSLFRIIEAMGRAQRPNRIGGAPQFVQTLKRWLVPRVRSRHALFAPTASSLYAARMTGDLGELWLKLQALLGDPHVGMDRLAVQARENFLAVQEHQPIVGHLLPYIPFERAQEYGVDVNPANGWLDTVPDA